MRALLLAAGLGTRLRPLTDHLPKCMVPIHGRPLLDYWLETLVQGGVDQILINTHYLAPLVVEFLSKSSWTRHVQFVHEDRLLGTGGTILKNRAFFENKAFIVAHADNLTLFDVPDFVKCHASRPRGTELTMMVFETPDPRSCGIVELNAQGIVQAFHEKVPSPPGNLANAAVYILEPSVVDFMAALGKEEIDFSTEVIPFMMGRISTFPNLSYHRDIGTVASWAEANRDFPVMPSLEQNRKAWLHILKSREGDLPSVIERLLVSPMLSPTLHSEQGS
ncbi:MAG: NTP transferase domain-containing protein [Sideroxydans sp.]|nr:NTP transferase domain-containing protein [Sideroxydans sp.]